MSIYKCGSIWYYFSIKRKQKNILKRRYKNMDIKYFKKYISVKTKKHWVLIGNVYGKGFTIVSWNK